MEASCLLLLLHCSSLCFHDHISLSSLTSPGTPVAKQVYLDNPGSQLHCVAKADIAMLIHTAKDRSIWNRAMLGDWRPYSVYHRL